MSDATEQKLEPWTAKQRFDGTGFNVMSAPVGGRTFRLFSGDHATERDAQLAAASPDLLEAAKLALNFIANTEGEQGITLDSGEALRAAIAKAVSQ